jgi:hypothetical protein
LAVALTFSCVEPQNGTAKPKLAVLVVPPACSRTLVDFVVANHITDH